MKETTYSLAGLCEAIEKAHGRITRGFTLDYPTDPRCQYSLRINVECENWNMRWYKANEPQNVGELLGRSDIVAFQWYPGQGNILRVVTREEEPFDSLLGSAKLTDNPPPNGLVED